MSIDGNNIFVKCFSGKTTHFFQRVEGNKYIRFLLNFRLFYAIISAEKNTAAPATRLQEPHKRGCISKRISKNFLEIFLEIAMPYGVRIF